MKKTLLFITLVVILVGGTMIVDACKKDEDNELEIPTGWQEGMTGKIIYTENTTDGAKTDRISYYDEKGKHSFITAHAGYYSIYGVKWSPDANKAAFGLGANSIIVRNIDGTDDTIFSEENCKYPDWSSDGKKLLFSRRDDVMLWDWNNNSSEIYNGFSRFSYSTHSRLDWSPDDTKIAYNSAGSVWGISSTLSVYNITNGSNYLLLPDTVFAIYPCWSPDGKKIAFIHYPEVYTVNANGEGMSPVSDFVDEDFSICQPCWSPDGSMIAVGSSDGVYVINLQGEIITLLPKSSGDKCIYVDWR